MRGARARPAALAEEVARAARRAGAAKTLFLDLDGTLAPFAPEPAAARVPVATLETLRRLARLGWTIAIVSGRPVSQARRLVPLSRIHVFGNHGFEGASLRRLAPDVRRRLAALRRSGRLLVAATPGALLERKPAGIAFHDRRVARRDLPAWRASLRRLFASHDLSGLEILQGRRVVEVRPAGHHKGLVPPRLLPRRTGRRKDPSLLAVGDDLTDEDLFRAIQGRGLAVRVGAPGATTLADLRLPSPRAVAHFLECLAEHLETRPAEPRHRRSSSRV